MSTALRIAAGRRLPLGAAVLAMWLGLLFVGLVTPAQAQLLSFMPMDSGPTPPMDTSDTIVHELPLSAVMLNEVPTSSWTYGCSATSAGMMFGYYDRNGYSSMYTGPANGGVAPLHDLGNQCSLIATLSGFDGRTTYGHVDDYWISYGSPGPDPWEGLRSEHGWADCTADFMGTNQWKWDFDLNGSKESNSDGATTLFLYNSGTRLYDYIPPAGAGLPQTELCHGLRLFAQSRGYSVLTNYSQRIDARVSGGFTFADYMAEIDMSCPVMIQVTGHSMVGVGYEQSTQTVYLHDTWDDLVHSMTWGGSYAGMTHQAMTVVHIPEPTTLLLLAVAGLMLLRRPKLLYQRRPLSTSRPPVPASPLIRMRALWPPLGRIAAARQTLMGLAALGCLGLLAATARAGTDPVMGGSAALAQVGQSAGDWWLFLAATQAVGLCISLLYVLGASQGAVARAGCRPGDRSSGRGSQRDTTPSLPGSSCSAIDCVGWTDADARPPRRDKKHVAVTTAVTLCVALLVLTAWVGQAVAVPVVYQGIDPGVGPGGSRPNSDAAAAAFDLAAAGLGPTTLIDFEPFAVGNFASMQVAPGITATLTGTANEAGAGICDLADAVLGYNTTAGGTKHLRVIPVFDIGTASLRFDFNAVPIQAFGTYLTGLGTAAGQLHMLFDDGTAEDLQIAGSPAGGVEFYGFTSAGSSIISVRLDLQGVTGGSRDIYGVDDVRCAVPEPATMSVLGLGGLALLQQWARRKPWAARLPE